ncbi:MAG: histidine phosphatase family protein [Candidatus Xenobia bacterium]
MPTSPLLELYLIRHGQTGMNASGQLQGHRDEPLSERGEAQARATASFLARRVVRVDAIYTSTLARAKATAETIAAPFNAGVNVDPALNEMDVGDLAGGTWDEARTRYPEVMDLWYSKPRDVTFPGAAESIADFMKRVGGLLSDIRKRHESGTVFVVSHGGPLNVCMSTLLKVGLSDLFPFHFSNCGITLAHVHGTRVRLQTFNEVCHLTNVTDRTAFQVG